MASKVFSFLYLNMGCEMMYIIEQRLEAQKICKLKAEKVINDILETMFERNFINEIFARRELRERSELQHFFEAIAHTSIMKLNEQSMSKLYDLMTMVFKSQLVFINHPLELLDITMNHLNSMLKMTADLAIQERIASIQQLFVNDFTKLSVFELQFLRHLLLNYFLDIKTRVSIFLREKTQGMSGEFLLKSDQFVSIYCRVPGNIKHFNELGEISVEESFPLGAEFNQAASKTSLGFNMYADGLLNEVNIIFNILNPLFNRYGNERDGETNDSGVNRGDNDGVPGKYAEGRDAIPDKSEHLLLSALLGKCSVVGEEEKGELNSNEFKLWLDVAESPEENRSERFSINEIDLSERRRSEKLEKIGQEFRLDESSMERDGELAEANDYLTLIDSNS